MKVVKPMRLIAAPISVVAMSFIFVFFGIVNSSSSGIVVVGILCALSVLIVMLPLFVLKDETVFSPIYYFAACVFISMPLRFFVLATYPNLESTHWFLSSHYLADFLVGAIMTCGGLLAFCVGYLSTSRRVNVTRLLRVGYEEISAKKLSLIGALIIPVAAYSILLSIDRSDVEGISAKRGVIEDGIRYAYGYWGLLPDFARILGVLLFAIALRSGKVYSYFGLFALLAVSISIFDAFTSQTRAGIPIAVLGVALLIAGALKYIPWVRIFLFSAVALVAFVAMTEIRLAYSGGTAAYLQRVQFEEFSAAERLLISVGGAYNLGGFVANTLAYEAIPERIPYQLGATYAQLIVMPIPRQIWPDKPRSLGYIWLEALRGESVAAQRRGGGSNSGFIAEAYLNFSWIGVVFIPFLFGFFVRIYRNSLQSYIQSSPIALCLVIFLNDALGYKMFGYSFMSGMMSILPEFAFILIVSFFIFLRKIGS